MHKKYSGRRLRAASDLTRFRTGAPQTVCRWGTASAACLLLNVFGPGCMLDWPAYPRQVNAEVPGAQAAPVANPEASSEATRALPDQPLVVQEEQPCADSAQALCNRCADGYYDAGDGCAPALTGLIVQSGSVVPALELARTDYEVLVPITSSIVTLTPSAAPGAQIVVNGQPLAPLATWRSQPLPLGVSTVDIAVRQLEHPERRYRLKLQRGSGEAAYIKAPNPGEGDRFGDRIAIAGDLLVIGAPFEDSSATGASSAQGDDALADSGAVYVFERSGDAWVERALLKASNADAADRFGYAVAAAGDTIVVSAPFEDSAATGIDGEANDEQLVDSGAVYVFERVEGRFREQAYLKPSRGTGGDQFGASLALTGDSLVIGAPSDDGRIALAESAIAAIGGAAIAPASLLSPKSGAAYVFARTATGWSEAAYLQANDAAGGDRFGGSVTAAGDTIVVGAEGASAGGEGALQSGAAYVFVREGLAWTMQAKLTPSTSEAFYGFGASVGLSADTLVVGAYGASRPQPAQVAEREGADEAQTYVAGAAYVFERQAGGFAQTAQLQPAQSSALDWFGVSVKIAGDSIMVGAEGEDSSATAFDGDQRNEDSVDSGAAYLFSRVDGAWSQQTYFKPSKTAPGQRFGARIAMSEQTIAVGAPGENGAAQGALGEAPVGEVPESGAVYVFR
jgi:trimeric autotransporter adhesin